MHYLPYQDNLSSGFLWPGFEQPTLKQGYIHWQKTAKIKKEEIVYIITIRNISSLYQSWNVGRALK
jgi:hypothetical protein